MPFVSSRPKRFAPNIARSISCSSMISSLSRARNLLKRNFFTPSIRCMTPTKKLWCRVVVLPRLFIVSRIACVHDLSGDSWPISSLQSMSIAWPFYAPRPSRSALPCPLRWLNLLHALNVTVYASLKVRLIVCLPMPRCMMPRFR